jgi:hypothetical protein
MGSIKPPLVSTGKEELSRLICGGEEVESRQKSSGNGSRQASELERMLQTAAAEVEEET